MPRVKIDYIVSFSSESPEAPASNLLANDAGKGRWLCARGEASCSVLLQLSRAVQISSITIGAHNTAFVEVLVGKSETPNDPFQVLIASSVFLSPSDSRKAVETERVRSFGAEQLAAELRARRFDRLRVVCSQPYNKHCRYGLSFIHIFSPEGDTTDKPVQAAPVLQLPFAMEEEESDDEFKPGALFAQHKALRASEGSQGSTDAQIRQASSQALKHQSDTSSKLVRTAIAKPARPSSQSETERPSERASERDRERLMYADEDDKPNDKIDRLVSAHKEQQAKTAEKINKEDIKKNTERQKEKDSTNKHSKEYDRRDTSHNQSKETIDKGKRKDDAVRHRSKEDRNITPQSNKRDRSAGKQTKDEERNSKKQKTTKDQDVGDSGKLYAGPVSSEPHTLLKDVVFVLSGYENPRRAAVRDTALALGAAFRRDWGPACTHLICAFSNTPKLRAVRSSLNGSSAVVVTAEWIERCAARRRRLPWQWFATEPKLRVPRGRSASGEDPPGLRDSGNKTEDSECDTDDEIEKALQKQKARRISSDEERRSPEDKPGPSSTSRKREESKERKEESKKKQEELNSSKDSDVAFVMDERIKGNITVSDSDSDVTDKEDCIEMTEDISTVSCLPSFFEGYTFALNGTSQPALDVNLLRRYVRAYGGEIVEPIDEEDLEVDYVLCVSGRDDVTGQTRGRRVRADWVWRCHETKALCSPGEYAM